MSENTMPNETTAAAPQTQECGCDHETSHGFGFCECGHRCYEAEQPQTQGLEDRAKAFYKEHLNLTLPGVMAAFARREIAAATDAENRMREALAKLGKCGHCDGRGGWRDGTRCGACNATGLHPIAQSALAGAAADEGGTHDER